MFWTVGLDLRAGCDGPAFFASWLVRETSSRGTGDRASAAHIVEGNSWQYVFRSRGLWGAENNLEHLIEPSALLAASHQAVETQLARTETREQFASLHVLPETTAEVGLAGLVQGIPGTGLIVGRRSKSSEDRFVRLGRVARKLLRSLPSPVIVTPPDLGPELGEGPIVFATDCGDDSIAAYQFAASLAQRLNRKLCLVYVVSMPDVWMQDVLLQPFAAVRTNMLEDGEKVVDKWIEQNQFAVDERVVAVGDIVASIDDVAASRRAPVVVCGSRRLGPWARIFVNSVASELAAASQCPVAVIPPDYTVGAARSV